ncbi:YlxR family protein [Microbacterium sp.]|uniref:YlxR family protein n=1 Tax=Microbacterium sp. TaxID=51671 RepID=UPI0037C55DC9
MVPVRTCVGCRVRAPRSALLRVVAVDSAVVIDEHARLPGRGAWLHDTPECMEAALRRRAFTRALRASGPLDTQAIEEHLQRKG